MVVNGRAEFVGSDATAARKAIEKTLTAPHGAVTIDADGGHIGVKVADLPISAAAIAPTSSSS